MEQVLVASESLCLLGAYVCLSALQQVQLLRKRLARWRTRGRLAVRAGLRRLGLAQPPRRRARGRPRTPPELEEALCRLHVDCPHLGARSLAVLLKRTTGQSVSVTTVGAIFARRSDFIASLEDARKQKPRTIRVARRCSRWALDFSLVWLLGVVPVWLVGVVDFHGSRVLTLEVAWPTSAGAMAVLERLFVAHGKPTLLQSDNGESFVSEVFRDFLRRHGVKQVRIRPGHPWTNGRIERVFRTFKEILRAYFPVLLSRRHLRHVCEDFLLFYNCCRPHSSWGGRTPEEVFTGKEVEGPIGRVTLFEGQVRAHRFV